MNRLARSAILSAAVAAATLVPALEASAGQRWREHRPKYPAMHTRPDQRADMLAAGILGLALGAIAFGAVNGNVQAHAAPGYFPPAPDGYYGDRGYTYAADLGPWTPEWYRYCSERYRSFDARTGTFRGYDGLYHFCMAD